MTRARPPRMETLVGGVRRLHHHWDCGNCHVITPTFGTNLLPTTAKPQSHSNHRVSRMPYDRGQFALYSSPAPTRGDRVSQLSRYGCRPPSSMSPWSRRRRPAITSRSAVSIATARAVQHQQRESGRLQVGAAKPRDPTLTVAGHATVAGVGRLHDLSRSGDPTWE